MEPVTLNENLAFLIGDVNHRIYQNITRIFRQNKYNVTLEQFSVLALLWYQDGLKQQEIAERLNRDKTTITRVVNNMIRQNLVVKIPDKTDLRATLIYLTNYGRQVQDKMVSSAGTVYMKMIKGLKKSDINITVSVLNTIISNLK